MKSRKYLLLYSMIFVAIFLTGCGSVYESTGWHGLTANGDTAYLTAGQQVYAIDLNTGNEDWRYPAKPNARITFYANPVLTGDGQLILSSFDSNVYSLNPATGSENWVFSDATNRLIASPLVTDNMIYQSSTDHFVYALDYSGRQVWRQETGGPIWAQPATAPDCGCIFVASMDHTVFSFNAETGRLIWQTPDLGGAMVGTPAVGPDGSVYVGTFGKEVIALDGSSGAVLWRFDTQDWVWSGLAFSDGAVYFGDLSGYFYALNAADGTSLWRIQPQNSIVSTPVIVDDRIYLTTEADSLFIVSTAGEIIDRELIGGMIYASPVIAGDKVLVSPTNIDALLYALNPDGNQVWTFTPAKK